MKTKVTKELLRELGFEYEEKTKGWHYPDFLSSKACLGYTEDIDNYSLKRVVDCMIEEKLYRQRNDICKFIKYDSWTKGD